MISYYLKVFLAAQPRFTVLQDLFGGFGKAIGTGVIGKLFGGGSGEKKRQESDIIQGQLEEQKRADDLAGSGDKSTIDSPDAIPTMAEKLGSQIGKIGDSFAGDFVEKLSSKFIDSKISSMFAPKPINPAIRGAQDAAYSQARYGNRVNPWELLGSGGAGGGAQGGRAPQQIQQETARETAATSARSQQRASTITTAPKIEEVNIKYQKLPHEVEHIGAETAGVKAGTAHQETLNKSLDILNIATREARKLKAVESGGKYDVASDTYSPRNIGVRVESEMKRIKQRGIQAVKMSGILDADRRTKTKFAEVYEKFLDAKTIAGIVAGLAGIATIIRLFSGRRGKSDASTSSHTPGKIKNWPRYGPKAGQGSDLPIKNKFGELG